MTETLMGRRARRGVLPVDVAQFAVHIESALDAFGNDVAYAVSMARSAVVIDRKRAMWQARRDLKATQGTAQN